MASPQLENGYTQIANEIIEALFKINLSPYENRFIWFILRKTYGWKKKTDWISLSQFAKEMGLDRRNIHRTIKKLSSKQMIVVYRDYKNHIGYGFQKNYEKWKVSSKKTTCRKSVIYTDDRVSSIETPTKKTITKEINIQEPLIPDIKNGKTIAIYFAEFYKYINKREYPLKFKKNSSQAKTLWSKIGNDIFPAIRHFIITESNERYYWTSQPKTFDVFVYYIDKIIDHMREYS